jgi:small GTP-binding protein
MLEKPKKLNVPATKEMLQIKIGLIGDQQAGKSSFVERCLGNACPNFYEPTLGVETSDKFVALKSGQVHVTFWDFSGRLDFIEIRNEMYKEATLIILFVDLTSKQSLESVDYWLREVKDNGGACPVYIVGNKADSKKVTADLSKVAREREGIYVEISCRSNEGVDQLFDRVVNDFK